MLDVLGHSVDTIERLVCGLASVSRGTEQMEKVRAQVNVAVCSGNLKEGI